MEMYCILEMDRPIKDGHYIVPGSFTFVFNNQCVEFDFSESSRHDDVVNQDQVSFLLKDLDITAFPKSKAMLSTDFLKSINNIEEFFVYTGEKDELEINLNRILDINFVLDGEVIHIPQDILNAYNETIHTKQQRKTVTLS